MAAGTDTTRNTAAEDIHIKYVIVEPTGRQITRSMQSMFGASERFVYLCICKDI